jgi:hypothetical protein
MIFIQFSFELTLHVPTMVADALTRRQRAAL